MATHPHSGLLLMEVVSSGHEIELKSTASLAIMMPRHGRIEVSSGCRTTTSTSGGVVAIGPGPRKLQLFPPRRQLFDGCQLQVPATPPLAADEVGRGSDEAPFFRTNDGAVPALLELVSYVLTDLASDVPILATHRAALQLDALVAEHIRQLLETEPQRPRDNTDRKAARLVRVADDYMRANYREPVRVADIARAAGIGTRRLQAIFKAMKGQTPWHQLTAIRLKHARLRLAAGSANDSVGRIALDCGFTHLGRFSALYRATYHETPSETLRQTARDGSAGSVRIRKLDKEILKTDSRAR